MLKLNAKQLRTSEPDKELLQKIKHQPIYIILDSVYDTYNIGAIFRLADAVAAEKVYLCGQTETPPNPAIKKASINTWQWVDWEYHKSAVEAVKKLRQKKPGIKIFAIEQAKNSISLSDFKTSFPLGLVVGNETYGVAKKVLEKVDGIVELPMFGVNKSLNVMVSLGIVLYKIFT